MTRQFITLVLVSLFTTLATASVHAVPVTSPFMGDLQLWNRADQGYTLNSGRVSAWNDLSGNGNNVVQGTSGQQPLWVSSGINGLPTIRFERTRADQLDNTISNIMAGTSPRTIFVVGEARSVGDGGPTTTGGSLFTFRQTTQVGTYQHWRSGIHYVYSDGVHGGGNATIPVAATTTIQSPFITVFEANQPNKILVSLNSISETVTQSIGVYPDTGATGFSIGARGDQPTTTFGWDGDISEVLVYDRLLTADELNHTGTYLAERYGITAPNYDFVAPVPEPSSMVLLGLGVVVMVRRTHRRKRRARNPVVQESIARLG